jgi:integrase
MSVYPEKRNGKPTGRYRIEVQLNGKRLPVHFSTNLKDAKKIEAQLKAGNFVPDVKRKAGLYTLSNLAVDAQELWAGTKDQKGSISRLENALGLLRTVLEDAKLPEDIRAVRTIHIDAAYRLLSKRGFKGSTLNRYTAALSKAFDWAKDRGYVDEVPKFQWRTETPGEVFYLTEEDEDQQKAVLKQRGHDDCILLMDVQIASGCRINELLRLTPDKITDTGDGFFEMDLGLTKNGKERIAVLPSELGESFRAMVEGGLPSYRSIWRRLKSARKAAGLPTTQPTHAHRHTTATRLSRVTTNTLLLQDFMGHGSLATTRRYVHNNVEAKKETARLLFKRPNS